MTKATKWWRVSWKRVGIILIVLFGVSFAASLVLDQLQPWLVLRSLAKNEPNAALVPVPLPVTQVAPLSGRRLTLDGFSFQTPWSEIVTQRSESGFLDVAFENGAGIFIPDSAMVSEKTMTLRRNAQAVQLLGANTVQSDYALLSAEMTAVPRQAPWWKPHANRRELALLGMKAGALHDATVIYAVKFGEVHGFQEGSPSVAPYQVYLDLFDRNDRHYQIQITQWQGSVPVLSQAEVNGIVASLKPVPQS